MKEVFTYLCDFSIVTSIAILLAVILRPVLKKGPSYVRCILWALVFLRLLLPVGSVEILPHISLFDIAEESMAATQEEGTSAGDAVAGDDIVRDPVQVPGAQAPTVQRPAVQDPAVQGPLGDKTPVDDGTVSAPVTDQNDPQIDQAPQIEKEPQPDDLPQPETPVQPETPPQAETLPQANVDVLFVLSVVWMSGVIAMLGYMLASNLLLRYRVRSAIVYDSRIRVIDRDCSPFVFGFFRPIIYIPASVNKTDWPHIIAHESSHIKRFDHVLKPLAFFVLCFYWFNPLVWVAYLLFSKDIEYACDERTVKSMASNDKKAYSLALLAVSQGENIVFAPPLSFGKVSVKERIKRVMTGKIPVWAMCLTIVICASLLVLVALTPSSADSKDSESDGSSFEESETGDDEPSAELELSVAYADPAELNDHSLFYDEQGYELVKIWVNKEVREFRFIEVLYDDNTDPYAGDALFEVAALTPDTPFYAQTLIQEGLSDRGISFVDDDGQTVCYRIMYDSYGAESTEDALHLERIAGRPFDTIAYQPNVSLPVYNVKIEYTDARKQTASRLILTEKESGREIQRITLPENERFTEKPAYAMDLTFDGYVDLIVPNRQPEGAVWYHAYVWDVQAGQLVYAPGFSKLSNVALDAEREQILSYRVANNVSTYTISVFDAEKQDFVMLHSLYWDWSDKWQTVFKEINEKGTVVNEFTFVGETLYPENPDAKQYFEKGSVWELDSAKWGLGAWSVKGVRYDENGNVILSDEPTYEEILALHLQEPEHYRDPGELQPETHEMIRLENGQWYQSFVYGSYNCRCVFLSNKEVSMYAYWDFLPIGSAENAFLYNLGVMYDDPSSLVPYTERSIAVRGTLTEAPDGYAYQLQLPDELIVCLERPGNIPDWVGNAYITETETLAIPKAYAALFEGKTGEVVVTGVVMQDRNGVFYLKDVELYLISDKIEPVVPESLPLPDFSSMTLSEFFPEGNKYFDAGADTFWVIDSYVRGDYERIKTRYALDENVVLPEQAPQNTIADYRDYCITQVAADSYELDGRQVEKLTVTASLYCAKEGQKGYLDFCLEFVNTPREFDWKLIRLDVRNGSKPTDDDTIPLTDPMTVRNFLFSSQCQDLQKTAFNFINAYFGGDYEEVQRMFIAPSWALDDPGAWNSRSRDDYSGYGISWVSFEPYELDGKQVQKAHFHLSMYRAVPGEEGVYDPCMELVYTDHQWKVLSLDFSA